MMTSKKPRRIWVVTIDSTTWDSGVLAGSLQKPPQVDMDHARTLDPAPRRDHVRENSLLRDVFEPPR